MVTPSGCLILGSVGFGEAASLAALARRAVQAEAAGCDAIKVPWYRARSLFAAPYASPSPARGGAAGAAVDPRLAHGEVRPDDLRRFAEEYADRLGLVVAVFDCATLDDVGALGRRVALLSVEASAATNPRLIDGVATTGLPTLVEVNLLTGDQIETMCKRFPAGGLTLMWRQPARPFGVRTIEGLFTLVRLQRYACPVGYVGLADDALAALIAVGFGATVVEQPLDGTSVDLGHLVSLVRCCQADQAEFSVEPLAPTELDTMDELRPSLVAARPIKRGEMITAEMVACKAPFRGLSANLLPLVVGRRAMYDLVEDEAITFGVLEL